MTIFLIGCILVFALLVTAFWLYLREPKVTALPPLVIEPDDPLINEAIAKAKASVEEFRRLYAEPHGGARVKAPFVTSSGAKEFLWAEVTALRETDMDVTYVTPPVTHDRTIEGTHTLPVADLADWMVELPSGQYAGGYTMRVMFNRAREQWGELPAELEAEEKKYS